MKQDERGKGQGLEDSKERDPGASEVATHVRRKFVEVEIGACNEICVNLH